MTAGVLQRGHFDALPDGECEAVPAPPRSVGSVYEQEASYVFRCLRGLGVREAHVEDAVQDVFLVVHDKLASFDGNARLRTWLYAIVIRVARRYRERQARAVDAEADALMADHDVERALLSRERLELARLALSVLSDAKREVFVLSEIEQLTAPEIASITLTPLNTVYARLRAARAEFERRIEFLEKRAEEARQKPWRPR
jgi:RNA polymerase sigma-70 factor (ECF subfamily)